MRSHSIIYRLLEDVGSIVVDRAPKKWQQVVSGQAQVLQLFPLARGGSGRQRGKQGAGGKGGSGGDGVETDSSSAMIAGCKVVEGRLERGGEVRVLRGGETVFEGRCATLRKERSEVDSVSAGMECGVTLEGWGAFRVGDVVQVLAQDEMGPALVSTKGGGLKIEYPEDAA